MKILFISKLTAKAAAGPNWSVPARIKAQSEYDEVLWVNVDNTIMPHWKETGLYHSVEDVGGKLELKNLPDGFSKPDLVAFEVPYFPQYLKFASELRKKRIPYIIVPRCSFTHQAINNHAKWKKKIAGWLMFNKFFKGAVSIQYLTEQEKNDSSTFINPRGFIIGNGITLPEKRKYHVPQDKIKGLFIGRIDIYHKGLDLLLDAIIEKKEFLSKHNVEIYIYGPENSDYHILKEKAAQQGVENIFVLKGGISGKDKEETYKNSDFFIMTSRFEGQPMAMLEALSYGLPCIATDGTYMREQIEDMNAGIGSDGDVESIGNALQKLVEIRESLPEKSENAYKLASRYNWKEQALRFHEEIQKLI